MVFFGSKVKGLVGNKAMIEPFEAPGSLLILGLVLLTPEKIGQIEIWGSLKLSLAFRCCMFRLWGSFSPKTGAEILVKNKANEITNTNLLRL